MRSSDLRSWISDNDLGILFSLAFVAWLIYDWHRRGVSYLAIAFIIPAAGALVVLIFLLVVSLFSRVPEPPISYGGGEHSVHVDFSSPLNRGVLEYLRQSRPKRKADLESASPTSVKNPLTKTDTYPEVGVRLWEELAASLPVDCRWIVCGVPALVHPQTGVLFGVAIGMAYCLRLTDADMERALQAGASTETIWSSGSTLDVGRVRSVARPVP